MNKTVLSIIGALVILSCSSPIQKPQAKRFISSLPGQGKYSYDIKFSTFNNKVEDFQQLMEEVLVWRSLALGFIEDLKETEILTNRQLVILHMEGALKYVEFKDRHMAFISEIKWITDPTNKIILRPDRPTEITEKRRRRKVGNEDVWVTYKKIYINPLDQDGSILMKRIKLGLASSLALYDTYMAVIKKFQKLTKVRQVLNYDNARLKYSLAVITKSYNNFGNFDRTAKAIKFFKKLEKYQRDNGIETDDDLQYFDYIIKGSASYVKLNKRFKKKIWGAKISYLGKFLGDYLKEAKNNLILGISKFFGNTVGLIQFRKGKMYKLSDSEMNAISSKFKALDILFEKTPFRLTDKFIPGHWGHVALWTGSKEELQEIGVWDHELIRPHQNAIEFEGKRIIEALRPGVQYNTFRHFLDIDDLGVIRPKNLSKDQKYESMVNAFRQLGKKYDFNFDVETDERIVCSELAYVTFPDEQWPTDKALGRYTISPDHVAFKVGPDKPFSPVTLFHDGREIKVDIQENFDRLLKLDYDNMTFE